MLDFRFARNSWFFVPISKRRGEWLFCPLIGDAHAFSVVIKARVFFERPISDLCFVQLSVTWQCYVNVRNPIMTISMAC